MQDCSLPLSVRDRLGRLLGSLYGPAVGAKTAEDLWAAIHRHMGTTPASPAAQPLSERDVLLITYSDQVREPDVAPLRTLARFCREELGDMVSGVHLLPFYPWSSDDGFAVKDYRAVAPEYGTWADVAAFRPRFDLMFDAVFNHLSAGSEWFQRFLRDDPAFRDFFVTVRDAADLSQVVRPRALPLLTEFATARGPERVWTTFSADQVDLNLKHPRVLLALVETLLFYVEQGARFIRLDAIAFLWKEPGTSCIHLPQTHAIIQIFRAVLDAVAPDARLITETNVPHADNLSYFGDGTNEAQLVYNFALPPLVLHALLRGDARTLTAWAATLRTPSDQTTFFNFLASHDGIGLNPVRGILPPEEIQFLVERCRAHGGHIGLKQNPDGSISPYELNIVYFDAVNDPAAAEPLALQTDRFLVSQAIMLALAGVPGIYFQSLFGSRNDTEGARSSGIPRRINRQKLALADLRAELAQARSLRCQIFSRYRELLRVRRSEVAFAPHAAQRIWDVDRRVFAVERTADVGRSVLCLHNVSDQRVMLDLVSQTAGVLNPQRDSDRRLKGDPGWWVDLLAMAPEAARTDGVARGALDGRTRLVLEPYAVRWLAAEGSGVRQLVAAG